VSARRRLTAGPPSQLLRQQVNAMRLPSGSTPRQDLLARGRQVSEAPSPSSPYSSRSTMKRSCEAAYPAFRDPAHDLIRQAVHGHPEAEIERAGSCSVCSCRGVPVATSCTRTMTSPSGRAVRRGPRPSSGAARSSAPHRPASSPRRHRRETDHVEAVTGSQIAGDDFATESIHSRQHDYGGPTPARYSMPIRTPSGQPGPAAMAIGAEEKDES
jgi:cobalamin biosynthesis Mg chelatase CobN